MKIGAMNHPALDPIAEIRAFKALNLDFIDLTLEPPGAGWWQCDPLAIRDALAETGLDVVGHTAYFLPLAHPFEEVRRGALEAFRYCLQFFAKVGVRQMNVHPDSHTPMHERSFTVEQNLKSLREIIQAGEELGVGVMVENLPRNFNTAQQLAELLDPLPKLGLHLDIGHTELMLAKSSAEEILERFGDRLRHVHLHDNKRGDADLHLPLGAGLIDVPMHLAALKKAGYDGTITLEVFTPDRSFLTYSAKKLREMWDET